LSPPLIIKSEQIDEMAAILASAIKRVGLILALRQRSGHF
jgi:hypothetical protein